MNPPHVVTKVALIRELPFTKITFYVEALPRMLFLLVPLQAGDVIPAQTCWTLFFPCKIILRRWWSTKYTEQKQDMFSFTSISIKGRSFIPLEIFRHCVGV